jgi:methylated-DNA-[protein]-cysteine S-methyltransferase
MGLYFKRTQTPVGEITIYATNRAVTGLFLGKHNKKSLRRRFECTREKDNVVLLMAQKQLKAYFAGRLKIFTVPVEISGTDFQKAVWQALRVIGYGELRTYADVAESIGNRKACRAVGGAIGSNPVPIIIPCHRVIGSDATLTGFGGGLPTKQYLLETEGHRIKNLKIDESRYR